MRWITPEAVIGPRFARILWPNLPHKLRSAMKHARKNR